jgi:LysM repeat protein
MQFLRQLGAGLIYALVSIILVVGGLSLSLAESYTVSQPSSTPTQPPLPGTLTPTLPGPTATFTATASPTATPPPPTNCPPPVGWIQVIVQPGDSIAGLAYRYRITANQLMQANCLSSSGLAPGYYVYVPPLPTNTIIPCGPFPGWILGYVVQPGDTLFHIATQYGTTVDNLKIANCKFDNEIFTGQQLWVPNVATITPGVTLIPTFTTPTYPPTATQTLIPFTATATPPTSTSAPATATPTQTQAPTSTSTPLPSDTPTATITAFPTTSTP